MGARLSTFNTKNRRSNRPRNCTFVIIKEAIDALAVAGWTRRDPLDIDAPYETSGTRSYSEKRRGTAGGISGYRYYYVHVPD